MPENIGHVIQVSGPAVDVQFAEGTLPPIYQAVKVVSDGFTVPSPINVILEVQQHLGEGRVRCIAMSATDGMVRGMKAIDQGGPISVPVGRGTLGRVMNVIGEPVDQLGPIEHNGFLLCHGSPDDEDEYLFNEVHASRIFDSTHAPIVLYGHTHLPVVFSVDDKGRVCGSAVRGEAIVRLDGRRRYLINPGSVGQPRDRNPKASFAIVDSRRMTAQFFRVSYNVAKTQSAILKAGLPAMLAHRLKWGV